MRNWRHIWIPGIIFTALIIAIPIVAIVTPNDNPADDPWTFVPDDPIHTSHADLMPGPYETGQDVTAACLECHEDAAHEVSMTSHWTWMSDNVYDPTRDEIIAVGKANVLNNFCIGIQSNEPGCTRCHAGYGWEDETFDFNDVSNVDCLICHDQSGGYVKSTAGNPAEGVDLAAAAQSVASPTRENCGVCHFNGGGGNAVKHGDLDESLYFPTEDLDVHMGRYDFVCTDCHRTENHQVAGRALSVSIDDENQIYCTDCHNENVHDDERITDHVDSVACQTCHIPAGARRDPTKMQWDWSTAGQDIPEDPHTYLRIKGSFVYEENFLPEYAWYNGGVDRYLLGDPIDPALSTVLNTPLGDINDPDAKIYPFKVHRANQIYDAVYNYLIQPKTVGDGGYWTDFDWNQAAELGMQRINLPYSGEYDFAATEMYWMQTHMVAPKEYALQCTDCHDEDGGGRMDWEALGYYGDPMVWGGRD
jgi:octaheme c-type cytochrome (tetrathionate reductase family)